MGFGGSRTLPVLILGVLGRAQGAIWRRAAGGCRTARGLSDAVAANRGDCSAFALRCCCGWGVAHSRAPVDSGQRAYYRLWAEIIQQRLGTEHAAAATAEVAAAIRDAVGEY